MTSEDGSAWTFASAGPNVLYAIAWSGAEYVAVGGELTGWIVSSKDGVTWTRRDIPGSLHPLYGVVWSGSEFLAVGAHGQIERSADGVSWLEGSVGVDKSLFSVAWTGGLYEAVGEDGTAVESADGLGWSARTSGMAGDLYCAVWIDSRLFALGRGGAILAGDCAAIGHRTQAIARTP
jgi:hypothetical protein